jgi:hypothetical protein
LSRLGDRAFTTALVAPHNRVVLVRSGHGEDLRWPDWPMCLSELELRLGQIDLVDVIKVTDGRWRSLLCADLTCCPPQGGFCRSA